DDAGTPWPLVHDQDPVGSLGSDLGDHARRGRARQGLSGNLPRRDGLAVLPGVRRRGVPGGRQAAGLGAPDRAAEAGAGARQADQAACPCRPSLPPVRAVGRHDSSPVNPPAL
ncbi:MAG: hypothetical protein AVDCRST_MAG31-2263, partial [uncultured Sphingomonas sp.]